MKKIFLTVSILFLSNAVLAQAKLYCGEVERLRVWANGSNTYGIWVEYKSNPEACSGGFFLPHVSANKDHLYSLILSSKATKERVCIQTYPENSDWIIGGRCKINYAMNE
jgi:hypothetical protein